MKTALVARAQARLIQASAAARYAYVVTRPMGAPEAPFHDSWRASHDAAAAASKCLSAAAFRRDAENARAAALSAANAVLDLSVATAKLLEDMGTAATLSASECVDGAADTLRDAAQVFAHVALSLVDYDDGFVPLPFLAPIASEGAE